MTIFDGHVFHSLIVIVGVSFAATGLRNWITREGLTWNQVTANAVWCAFIVLFLLMLADMVNLRRWYWAELLLPLVYTALGSPHFLGVGARDREVTAEDPKRRWVLFSDLAARHPWMKWVFIAYAYFALGLLVATTNDFFSFGDIKLWHLVLLFAPLFLPPIIVAWWSSYRRTGGK